MKRYNRSLTGNRFQKWYEYLVLYSLKTDDYKRTIKFFNPNKSLSYDRIRNIIVNGCDDVDDIENIFIENIMIL